MKPGRVEKYILEELEKRKLLFAVIDPLDHPNIESSVKLGKNAEEGGAGAVLVGGSTGVQGELLDEVCKRIKEEVSIPVILFPGNIGTVSRYADAIYFMSLLNSRNPYWITGAQTLASPLIRKYNIEALSTGYVVVEPGGTVGWVGDAKLIPRNKPALAAALGMAAEYIGFHFFITDAGSNPKEGHIPLEMIKTVKRSISIPYIVAGGIRSEEEARNIAKAGADIIQVGTAFEKDNSVERIRKMVNALK